MQSGVKRSDLKKLYAKRWNVETNFRTLKVDTLLENFSGKKVIVIFQEVHAAILIQNLARIFEYDLFAKRRLSGEKAQPNHREALGFIKLVISQLLRLPTENWIHCKKIPPRRKNP